MNYSRNKTSRLAGFIYLLLIIFGIIGIAYIPSQLIDWNDASKTVSNISENMSLFQLGIIFNIFCYLCYLFLVLVLFQLLKKVNKTQAWLMLILVLVSIPISLVSVMAKIDVLSLLKEADYLGAINTNLLNAKIMLSLDSYNNGIIVSQVFWGLWLFPFGYLVYKSNFLPKFLGIMLMIGCLYYFMDSMAQIAFPSYRDGVIDNILSICAMIGEFGICLWLLILGDKAKIINTKR